MLCDWNVTFTVLFAHLQIFTHRSTPYLKSPSPLLFLRLTTTADFLMNRTVTATTRPDGFEDMLEFCFHIRVFLVQAKQSLIGKLLIIDVRLPLFS